MALGDGEVAQRNPWAPAVPAPRRPRRGPGMTGLLILGFKLLKSTKILLALASLATWSLLLSWQLAVVFLFGLCLHEWGHVWAMHRCGIPTKGFYLIPFVGGVCSPQRPFEHRFEEAFVAAMGPVFGLAAAPLCLALGWTLTGSAKGAANAMDFVVVVNLFNLLPIVPMDGGRMIRAVVASLNRAAGIVLIVLGFGLALYLAWRLPAPILVWIAALGIAEAAAERKRGAAIASLSRCKAALWLGAYLAIGAAAVGLLLVGAAIKGDSAVLDLLRSL
jgi:Zn-dependent protease